jgi:hypothetical protein
MGDGVDALGASVDRAGGYAAHAKAPRRTVTTDASRPSATGNAQRDVLRTRYR